MAPLAHFEVLAGKNNLFYWHLVGGNGEVMNSSEGYVTPFNAKRAAKRFVDVAAEAGEQAIVMPENDEEEPERDEQED